MPGIWDVAIIGSGVAGGRIADELTQSGASCALIEAGREYSAQTFPPGELQASTKLFWNGGLEVSADGRLGFLRAKCLGGTSVVNQALLNRFDDLAWDDWRDRTGINWLNSTAVNPLYDELLKSTRASEIPVPHYNGNTKAFTRGFDRLGFKWEPVLRSQGDCALEHGTDCIVCLGGCPRDSKQSALITTIRRARSRGLEVLTQHEVLGLEEAADHVRLFTASPAGRQIQRARRVVLAAGALGTTGILLRSGLDKKLPALGKGFSCHPQFMCYGLFEEPVNAHKGALQAVESADRRIREMGIKFENVYAPPVATSMLVPGFGRDHREKMKRYRYYSSLEVAIRDEPLGTIRLKSDGRLTVAKPLSDQDRNRIDLGHRMIREFLGAAGAKSVIEGRQGFGLHLMGGAALGTDPMKSVVDPDFCVHGHRRLYVADSSVFPSAPGINPSFTVMAMALRAAGQVARGAE